MVTWSEEVLKSSSKTGIGIVKPYKLRELNKLKGFEYKSRITIKYESSDHYYLLIPDTVNNKKRRDEKESVIAFDIGVRAFQTGFTNKGHHFVEYGKQDTRKLFILDKIHCKIDKYKKECYFPVQERTRYKNQRRKWHKQAVILRYRVQNLNKDMHWRISRDIVQQNQGYINFQIPRF
jgi:transposase